VSDIVRALSILAGLLGTLKTIWFVDLDKEEFMHFPWTQQDCNCWTEMALRWKVHGAKLQLKDGECVGVPDDALG
jgi:hypothetical protein